VRLLVVHLSKSGLEIIQHQQVPQQCHSQHHVVTSRTATQRVCIQICRPADIRHRRTSCYKHSSCRFALCRFPDIKNFTATKQEDDLRIINRR